MRISALQRSLTRVAFPQISLEEFDAVQGLVGPGHIVEGINLRSLKVPQAILQGCRRGSKVRQQPSASACNHVAESML